MVEHEFKDHGNEIHALEALVFNLRTFGLIRYDQEIGLLVAARVKTLGVEEEHVMMGVLGRTGCKYCTQKLS